MERILEDIATLVRTEVKAYNDSYGLKTEGYFVEDDSKHAYLMVEVPYPDNIAFQQPIIVVMARVIEEYVLIDEDITDRPLVKELVSAGIPRDKIICVYNGETIPPHILRHMQQHNPTYRVDNE
jgi:hypothetical protein